jgi:L-ascorbate metabolism protein UlaG (beta-lactamase superfamily)
MRLTKFGHSCLLVEEGGARVLLDPGSFSEGFESLEGLTAVCVTHKHTDHLDTGRLRRLLDRNPGVRVVADEGSAGDLGQAGADVEVVHHDDELELGGLGVRVAGRGRRYYANCRIEIRRVHRDRPGSECDSRHARAVPGEYHVYAQGGRTCCVGDCSPSRRRWPGCWR